MLKFLWGILKNQSNKSDFWSHVDELRRRIIISLFFVFLFSILSFFFKNIIFDEIILKQISPDFFTYKALCYINNIFPSINLCVKSISNFHLINTEVGGQFRYHLVLSILCGFILASPFIFYQLWVFIRPSLYENELMIARKFIFYLTFLFLIGIAFGYFIISPLTLNFLLTYELSPNIENMISINSFVSTISVLSFSMGIVFELPILIYFLTKVKVINSKFLKKQRRIAFIVIFIIAGFITPSTDIFSQTLVGLPLYILFELGIIIAKKVERKYLLS
jgi:sec-independent protein translocase protein TatC